MNPARSTENPFVGLAFKLEVSPINCSSTFLSHIYVAMPCRAVSQGKTSRPDCSKLMSLLDNISLKFQMLISEIFQYLLLKKM